MLTTGKVVNMCPSQTLLARIYIGFFLGVPSKIVEYCWGGLHCDRYKFLFQKHSTIVVAFSGQVFFDLFTRGLILFRESPRVVVTWHVFKILYSIWTELFYKYNLS